MIRVASSLTNKNSTQFALARTINQAGASLSCTAGREHIMYSVDVNRQQLDGTLTKLSDAATQQTFKPWEIKDNIFRIKLDLASIQPQTQVLELLHKVAFRSGLANSLYCPSHLVGKHSPEILQSFVDANLRADNATVVGVGVAHDRLVAYAQSLALKAGQPAPVAASKVNGGDIRLETGGPLAFVAVAVSGASLTDTKKMLAFALLQRFLGVGNPVKYGSGASKLNQAVLGAGAVSALNMNYSDAGLFGFVAAAPAGDAGKVVSAAAKVLRSVKIDETQLTRAKKQLKADILMAQENTSQLLEELSSPNRSVDLLEAISKLSVADVNGAAAHLASAKLAVAAVGNLANVPFADEL